MKKFITCNSLRQALVFILTMIAFAATFCDADDISVLLATKAVAFALILIIAKLWNTASC